MKYRPRNNLVLIRRERIKVVGLHMPDEAQEGNRLIVEAIGPQVENLYVGDVVLAIGTPGQDLVRIPTESNLFLTKEANVLAVVEAG